MEMFVYQTILKHEEKDWWYKGLRAIVSSYINKFSKNNSGRLLDIGCGTGYFLTLLKDRFEIYGIDISADALKMARSRGLHSVKLGKIENLPYRDCYFDVILVLDVLEHLKDDMLGLSEVYRVLKPGGIAIFNSPAYKFLWTYHDISAKHYRRYTKHDLAKKILKSNFKILKITYINFFLFPVAFVHRKLSNILSTVSNETDVGSLPSFLRPIFSQIFSFESYLLRYINFPLGLSVSAVATKEGLR